MLVYQPFQIIKDRERSLDVLLRTPMLSRTEAEHVTCYYLLRNIEFTIYTLFGVRLLPYQGVIIRMMLRKPYILSIISRGGSKTFLSAVYAALKGIITPGTKLLGVGSNRRQSRFIYNHIQNIYNNKKASIFRDVVRKLADQPEESYIDIHGGDSEKTSRLSFTPIANGDRIRGFRANVLLVDEANIISQEIYDTVLRPMLAVGLDPVTRVLQLEKEKKLIEAGVLKAEDAIELGTNQVIMSSSAGYQFSFLYKKYLEYKDKILIANSNPDPKAKKEASKYGIIQLSFEAIELMSPGYLNIDSILADKKTFPADRFLTEYCAQFATDSGGYIPRSLLESRQIQINSTPMVERKGVSEDIYILAIDPSSGQNTENDFFAIMVIKLDVQSKTAYCVNASASAGKGWPHYVKLVRAYIKNFKPKYIIMDSYGGGSQTKDLITHPDFTEAEEGEQLLKTIDKDDLTTYCHAENKILRMTIPSNSFNEQSNVNLKSMLEHHQFWFASPINEATYKKEADDRQNAEKNIDELEDATEGIELAKSQIALIVPKQGNNGLTTFGMPDSISNVRKQERMRKDLYSTTLLGAWGVKEYLTILENGGPKEEPYSPVIVLA